MIHINPYFLHVPLDPLSGLGDDDESVQKYWDYNLDDQKTSLEVIKTMIRPYMDRLSHDGRDRVRNSMRYYLVKGGVDFGRVYDSVLPPIRTPTDPRRWFELLYQQLFPGQSIAVLDDEKFQISKHIEEPNRYRPRG